MFFCFPPGISPSAQGCCRPKCTRKPVFPDFLPVGVRSAKTKNVKMKCGIARIIFLGGQISPPKLALAPANYGHDFFFHFGTPFAVGPTRGPAGLVGCCCLLLLDAQAPPKWLNNLINRLKYYVLQLGDPHPNEDLVLGPLVVAPTPTRIAW